MSRSRLTTVLVAFMVVFSMVAVATPAMAGEEGGTDEVHTLENGEGLYLVFGADLGDQSLEEYIEAHADPDEDNGVDVVEYEDVDDVELVQEGQATSVSIDGGEATAIQDATQRNANSQDGEASAESYEVESHTDEFNDVGDVTVIFGEDGQDFEGWGTGEGDGDDVSVSQSANATVTQSQDVEQANVNEQSTALAYAENGSEAIAFQQSQQSNLNLQEGSANATNVLAADLDGDEDREEMREKHKKKKQDGDSDVDVEQDANATIEQDQAVDQANVNEQTGAVAIAVGEDSVATAVQMTDQSNLNEQVATADALNAMLETAGMNVATAGSDAGADLLTQDGEKKLDPKEKKDGDGHDVTQTAEASVVQNQSVEQANFNNQTAAAAIAVDGSESIAVQLSYQENINAQVASADVLNVLGVEADDLDGSEDGDFDGVVLRNTTSVNLEGDGVEGDSHLSFDYDGDSDQRNDVEQWSTAEIEQSQEVAQLNLNEQRGAIAVSEDGGSAEAVQLTIQENENVQFASAESTNVAEGTVDEGDEDHEKGDDHEKDDEDHEKSDGSDDDHEKDDDRDGNESDDEDTDNDSSDDSSDDDSSDDDDSSGDVGPSDDDGDEDKKTEDRVPGFGVLVAVVALAIVGAARVVSDR